MKKYNALIYGNGMTIMVMNLLKRKALLEDESDFNLFIDNFFNSKGQLLDQEFKKYFKMDTKTKKKHFSCKKKLIPYMTEVKKIGFERAVGKHIFGNNPLKKDEITYLYLLHNYWYHLINQKIILNKEISIEIERICTSIRKKLHTDGKILTTNFDTILDVYLNPDHLHGRFILPLNKINDIILHEFGDHTIEYTYLFGGNGLEKLSRLHNINKLNQQLYNLSFFYNQDISFGKILIYGLSFSDSGILSEEFLKKYPKYENLFLVQSVDGHIIQKLELLYAEKKVKKIDIAYYSEPDLNNYKNMFSKTKIEKIVKYIHTKDVFKFDDESF